jgi:CHAD domain-containing protein
MPSGHREVETKYDVDDATALPELGDLPDVASIVGPRTFRLEATYFDTDSVALGRHGITLRRRTGGDDEGWHLKLPVDGARQEIHAPLGRSAQAPPIALRRIVQGVVRGQKLGPVVTVETERTLASLFDVDEGLLAQVCDDRVSATRIGAEDGQKQTWREWEFEEHGARRRLTKAAHSRMRKAGARVATHQSKFGRVMQLDREVVARDHGTTRKHASEHELLGHHLATLRADLHRLDPLTRADVPDAVHQLRVVCRKLRATLTTFDKSLDVSRTEPVREELSWFAEVLGRPRDLEVLRARLAALVLSERPALLRGRPGPWIDGELRKEHRTAHRDALDAMASDRYFALVDELDSWRSDPPWADRADRPATKRLPKALDREWRRVLAAAADAEAASDAERPPLLHDVRKAAKRARYAAETLSPVLGSSALALAASAKAVQSVLGNHHDAVVAAERVVALAGTAEAEGRTTFTLGVLHARLESDAAELESEFEKTWKTVSKRL